MKPNVIVPNPVCIMGGSSPMGIIALCLRLRPMRLVPQGPIYVECVYARMRTWCLPILPCPLIRMAETDADDPLPSRNPPYPKYIAVM